VTTAQECARQFQRLAATWRDLVVESELAPEPLSMPDLVEELRKLLETEARIDAIDVSWGHAERVRVLQDRRVLSRALLEAFLTAFQVAGVGGRVQLAVSARQDQQTGVASVHATGASGAERTTTVGAALVS
jgi:sigma-54 dependent transcriptional regulator, acetoin dehydrogenase operon transcriptional activator AcoR